jgi:hypothetical protein
MPYFHAATFTERRRLMPPSLAPDSFSRILPQFSLRGSFSPRRQRYATFAAALAAAESFLCLRCRHDAFFFSFRPDGFSPPLPIIFASRHYCRHFRRDMLTPLADTLCFFGFRYFALSVFSPR